MKKVIVMGATSGIGREIAMIFLRNGYDVGVAGRRQNLLDELKQMSPSHVFTKTIDVSSSDAQERLHELIEEMGGVDIYVHSSGYGRQNATLSSEINDKTVMTNVLGFTRMMDFMFKYFEESKRHGQIAAISSIAGTKGLGVASTYSASKRYQWIYIESLSQLASMKNVDVCFTDIRPGFVATDFLSGDKYPMLLDKFFVARKIVSAIQKEKRVVVIDWRYRVLCFFWRLIPSSIWRRLHISNG